jgi:LuxR family maltose regulon positive regulatory protein
MTDLRVGTAGRGVSSKVHPPRRRRGHVARRTLIEHIRGQEPDLLLVTAAAGYGKSTLLSEFAATDERPHAWLTIDESHDEPAVLLGDIAFALNQIEPIDPFLSTDLWNQPSSVPRAVLNRFEQMLQSRRQPFTLVLDDCHAIRSPEAVDALTSVIDHIPPGSMLVLGARSRPLLPLGRIRTTHVVVEMAEPDLALDVEDVAAMFRALAVDITADDARRLVEHTEGWPLAIYLAALARRNGPRGDDGQSVTDIAGDSRVMVEYFSDVILSGLEPEVAAFLLHVAPLDRFSGRLCDHVLERSGSAMLLEDLHRRNLLVVALDERRQWYRLHHLLAAYLTAELDRREPTAANELRARASEWHAANGDAEESISYAVRAGDKARAAQLVLQHVPLYSNVGRHTTIERWLRWFDEDDLAAHPKLSCSMALGASVAGNAPAASMWLDRAAVTIGLEHPDTRVGFDKHVALALARGGVGWLSAAEFELEARYAYERLEPAGDWRTFAGVLLGAAETMLGHTAAAEVTLREAIVGTETRLVAHTTAAAELALLLATRGDWDEAIETARRARMLLGDRSALPATALVLAVSSLTHAKSRTVELAAADHQLARSHIARFARIGPWLNLLTRLALARSSTILGRTVEATTLLDETQRLLASLPDAVGIAAQVADVRRSLGTNGQSVGGGGFGPAALTTAELRVLQYLPTHLTVGEIAERLYLSRNTVKTHTITIYRKLGTSARGGAVEIARAAGLLG